MTTFTIVKCFLIPERGYIILGEKYSDQDLEIGDIISINHKSNRIELKIKGLEQIAKRDDGYRGILVSEGYKDSIDYIMDHVPLPSTIERI